MKSAYRLNAFRVLADCLHLASKLILITSFYRNKSAEGVSLITQVLYLIVFFTRYLDILWEPITWGLNLYNFSFKIFYLTSSAFTILLMTQWYARSRESESAWKLGGYSLAGSTISTIPLGLLFKGSAIFRVSEAFWAFSIILEAFCVLPQLQLLRQTDIPTVINSCYLLALGSYRLLYIFNWGVRVIEEGYLDIFTAIFGLIQTAFYLDFAWVYWMRQRVKLRNGSLIDSDDIRQRAWFIRWFLREGKSPPTSADGYSQVTILA